MKCYSLPDIALPIILAAVTGCRSTGGAVEAPAYLVPTATSGPVLFSPGYISVGLGERDAAFAFEDDVFAFTQMDGQKGTIVLLQSGALEIAPFSGEYSDLEPFFDPRGGVLWFASRRPHPDDASRSDSNIWRVARSDAGWGEPEIVRGLDGPGDEFYPTVALDGTVAFTAVRDGGLGGEDIWLASHAPSGGWQIENAGPGVNGPGAEFNALITPDGRMLIFSTDRPAKPGEKPNGDLYASTRRVEAPVEVQADPAGDDAIAAEPAVDFFVLEAGKELTFGEAVSLAPYNSDALDYCPALTANGTYLVFTSRRRIEHPVRKDETFKELRQRLMGPGNGRDDLWWALMPTIRDTP